MQKLMAAAILLLACAGCDKDESFVTRAEEKADINGAVDDAIPRCTPGRVVDCPCAMGASGTQTCATDGKSWSACTDCWSMLTSGSSSSSGGAAPMTQTIACDKATQRATALYPGKKAEELFMVRLIGHDSNAMPPFDALQVSFGDGYAWGYCGADYDVFIGP